MWYKLAFISTRAPPWWLPALAQLFTFLIYILYDLQKLGNFPSRMGCFAGHVRPILALCS
jgi:hypothetical protein